MVESTALEMRRTGNRTVGSNPTLSATPKTEALSRPGHRSRIPRAFFKGFGSAEKGVPVRAMPFRRAEGQLDIEKYLAVITVRERRLHGCKRRALLMDDQHRHCRLGHPAQLRQ